MPSQCIALTTTGSRCKRNAVEGSQYCKQHLKQHETALAADEQIQSSPAAAKRPAARTPCKATSGQDTCKAGSSTIHILRGIQGTIQNSFERCGQSTIQRSVQHSIQGNLQCTTRFVDHGQVARHSRATARQRLHYRQHVRRLHQSAAAHERAAGAGCPRIAESLPVASHSQGTIKRIVQETTPGQPPEHSLTDLFQT